jgi:hypothetical protein
MCPFRHFLLPINSIIQILLVVGNVQIFDTTNGVHVSHFVDFNLALPPYCSGSDVALDSSLEDVDANVVESLVVSATNPVVE